MRQDNVKAGQKETERTESKGTARSAIDGIIKGLRKAYSGICQLCDSIRMLACLIRNSVRKRL